jgi:hypothetical protein
MSVNGEKIVCSSNVDEVLFCVNVRLVREQAEWDG